MRETRAQRDENEQCAFRFDCLRPERQEAMTAVMALHVSSVVAFATTA
jgi:hypothetical protein